jgi:hypothetical protein
VAHRVADDALDGLAPRLRMDGAPVRLREALLVAQLAFLGAARFTFGMARNRDSNVSGSSRRPCRTEPKSIASLDSSGSSKPLMKCAGLISMRLSCAEDWALRSPW